MVPEKDDTEARKARAARLEIEIEKLKSLPLVIEYARQHAPPNMQQDEQDFDDWVQSGWGTGFYLSWPRGQRARVTVQVNMVNREVSIYMQQGMSEEEAAPYKGFAEGLRKYLAW